MGEYEVRDFLEMLEDSAEMKLDEMTKGLPRGKFRCNCGKIDDLDNAHPVSNNPYATPICGDCFDMVVGKNNTEFLEKLKNE